MKKDKNKGKVNICDNIQIEREEDNYNKYKNNDFIPNDYHWTNIDEQKIKVKEIENKTK